ncbi:hypothetical protein Bbelb_107550 [Branchiostoma belcheri]|nr:hypothetical protein Bbelb_107550 [Branchiostoma belcheri]
MPSLRDSLAYEGFPQATRRVLEQAEAACSGGGEVGGGGGNQLAALVEEFVHFRPPDALPHHTGIVNCPRVPSQMSPAISFLSSSRYKACKGRHCNNLLSMLKGDLKCRGLGPPTTEKKLKELRELARQKARGRTQWMMMDVACKVGDRDGYRSSSDPTPTHSYNLCLNALQELQLLQILSDYFGGKTNAGLARQVFMVLFATRGGADRLTDHKVKLLGKLVSMCIATQHEMVLDCTSYWILQEGTASPPVLTLLTSVIQVGKSLSKETLSTRTLDTLRKVDKTSPSFACQFVTIVTGLYQLKPVSSSHPPPALLEVIAEWVAGNPRICLASLKDTKGSAPVTPIPGLCHWCVKSPLVQNPEKNAPEDAILYSKLHLGVLQSLLAAQTVAPNAKLLPVPTVEEIVADLRALVSASGQQGEAAQTAVERLAQVMQVAMATGCTHLSRKQVAGVCGKLPENRLLGLILGGSVWAAAGEQTSGTHTGAQSIPAVRLALFVMASTCADQNNPWQCDCRMVSFRQKMVGKVFEDHIICEEPSRLFGQKLKDIDPDDLICDEPQIVTFKMINGNRPVLEGETLSLKCDLSGIPTPDITVTLPSGRNATVESGGGVTVEANGTITIENITATDSGLYVCLAASSGGSTSANLSIYVQEPSSLSPTNYGLEGQGVHFSTGTSRLGYRIATSSENLDGQGMSSTQGTVALSGENIYENDDEADLTVDSVYENDNEVEEGGHESVHLYGNEDEPVATVSGLQTNMYENDNEVEQGRTAPVNVYENDNEVEEGGTVPVNVYENDNEVEEGGTVPVNVYENDNEVEEGGTVPVNVYENDNEVEEGGTTPVNVYENDDEDEPVAPIAESHTNVYENDNEVEEGGTVSPDPVSELHEYVYENDDEDVASIHSIAVQHSYVYENDNEVFIESVVQEETDVYENSNEKVASTFVHENDEYHSDDEKAKYASSKSVYENENKKTASATVQPLYKKNKSVENTSQLIYGKEKDETATDVNLYGATNVDMDKDYL